MQIGINQVKNGLTIELDNDVYCVVDSEPVKPGKGSAFLRTKLKNMRLGTTINRTFRSNEKIEVAYIDKKNMQYLYCSHDMYEFMDHETYEQLSIHRDQLGDVVNYLKENIEMTAIIYKNKVIAIEPPTFIDLKIISTEPGVRGDTSKAGTKPAETETGLVVTVPLFINEGDVIRVDTRTNEYTGRA